MSMHPIFLRVDGRRCVVVGGDATAARRARALRAAGGCVIVLAPHPGPEMVALLAEGGVEHLPRDPERGDLSGVFLAYACGCDRAQAVALAAEAAVAHVLLNVADMPTACSFHEPAVVDRGELKIAVGTGGASPGLAGAVRRELEGRFGPEYRPFVRILGAVRRWQRGGGAVEALRTSSLLELIRQRRSDEIDRLLTAVVGEGCTLSALGVEFETATSWN